MKPLIVGMNNPQGNEPLWPDPPGCSGHRLLGMLQRSYRERGGDVTATEFTEAFDRVNLCRGTVWDIRAARAAADGVLEQMQGRQTLLLGRAVTNCLGYGQPSWMVWRAFTIAGRTDGTWMALPHPSGMTRCYNNSVFRGQTGDILLELYLNSIGKA